MSKIIEIFGTAAETIGGENWRDTFERQWCPYIDRKCLKVRKSQPRTSIGTCSVLYGEESKPIIICPLRLLERRQVFTDCLHLLSVHEPGNELHIVPEISLPGGNVDYFLASVKNEKIRDFVGIELQTLDTTGTVWPERQRFIASLGFPVSKKDVSSSKGFGMNWKMTAKTTMIQLHHKIQTFEYINKHLVLVMQDHLLQYLQQEFQFSHIKEARFGDPMHLHVYGMKKLKNQSHRLDLVSRLSTDTQGITLAMGLQAESNVELGIIIKQLESKISGDTLFRIG